MILVYHMQEYLLIDNCNCSRKTISQWLWNNWHRNANIWYRYV